MAERRSGDAKPARMSFNGVLFDSAPVRVRGHPRPGRERFFRHEAAISVLAVVEVGELLAIIGSMRSLLLSL
jgi:hypothetical protein